MLGYTGHRRIKKITVGKWHRLTLYVNCEAKGKKQNAYFAIIYANLLMLCKNDLS